MGAALRPRRDRGNGRWQRALALFATVIVTAALLLALKSQALSLNLSASMPLGLYRPIPVARPLQRGDMIEICAPPAVARLGAERAYLRHGSCPFDTSPLLKYVGGIGGDVVDVGAWGVRINGIVLPGSAAAPHDGEGRSIPRITGGRRMLHNGELWVWSPFPHGWDSRYYGALPAAGLVAIVRPVFIVGNDAVGFSRNDAADQIAKSIAAGSGPH